MYLNLWLGIRLMELKKGNKTIPEKVATTRTEDGHK